MVILKILESMWSAYSWWQWLMFFYTYCFFGWVWESCYVSFCKKRWVNRGFLHLPLLPLYGSGACVILFATMPFREHLLLLYLSGMVGASTLEMCTGLAMERIYKVKYWDYTNRKFNFKGVICLEASLLWGVFSVLMVKVVHTHVAQLLSHIPLTVVYGAEAVITVAFVYDFYVSNREALQLAHVLSAMETARTEIREKLEQVQESLEEQQLLLEMRLEEAREHAEDQIEERILEALERMYRARENMEYMQRELNEARDSLREAWEDVRAAAEEARDEARDMADELKEELLDTADEIRDHVVESVRLNLIFHSDVIVDQMEKARARYEKGQKERMELTESLSRGILLRNPTAQFRNRKELSDAMRTRALEHRRKLREKRGQ